MSNLTRILPPAQPRTLASGQIVKAAMLDSRDLKPRERLVMIAVAAHGNGMGDAWPSVATIAEYVGCSVRTVQRILGKLVDMGRLVARLRKGAETVYRLTRAAIARVVGADRDDNTPDNPAPDPRQNDDQGMPKAGGTPDNPHLNVSGEVGSSSEASKRASAGGWRRYLPPGVKSKTANPAPRPAPTRNAALPLDSRSQRCPNPRHPGQLAHNCAVCRGEQLARQGENW